MEGESSLTFARAPYEQKAPKAARETRRSSLSPISFSLHCLYDLKAATRISEPPRRAFLPSGLMFIKKPMARHLRPPKQPSQLPSIDHNGTNVEVWEHYGYSTPSKGPAPKSRVLYAARDANQERHWRGTYEEIKSLIDRNFQEAPLASGLT